MRANRTIVLDQTFDHFRREQSLLPQDRRPLGGNVTNGLGDDDRQVTAAVRVIQADATGNPFARYDRRGKPDHFAHAEADCALALARPRSRKPKGLSFAFV